MVVEFLVKSDMDYYVFVTLMQMFGSPEVSGSAKPCSANVGDQVLG